MANQFPIGLAEKGALDNILVVCRLDHQVDRIAIYIVEQRGTSMLIPYRFGVHDNVLGTGDGCQAIESNEQP